MAEPSPLDTILGVLQVQIKTKDDARFALEHVSTFFIPTTNHSAASSRHVLDHVLGALMSQISNEIDAAFALRRISNLHASIVANLAKAQESGASQNAKSSSSSASFALDAISSQSAKTEASAFAKSEAPKLSSTVPAPSNITARQAPTSVNSEAPKPLSATPALSKTTLQRPPTSTKSGAPKLSSDTPALPNITPQQPPAPLVTSRVLPEKPKGPTCSAEQLPTSPYVLTSMYTPARGDRLSYELAKCVGPYQDSSSVVLSKLIKHGGRNHHPKGYRRGAPLAQRLDYYDYSQRLRSMAVQRDVFDDHNGWRINIPYVSCNQYLDLYSSMVHINPGNMHTICREILDEGSPSPTERTSTSGTSLFPQPTSAFRTIPDTWLSCRCSKSWSTPSTASCLRTPLSSFGADRRVFEKPQNMPSQKSPGVSGPLRHTCLFECHFATQASLGIGQRNPPPLRCSVYH